MPRFKDFGSGSDTANDPISFMLNGETFNCRPAIPGKVILELVGKSSDEENPGEAAAMISEFFSIVLVPESFTKFDELAKDPDIAITVEALSEIVSWLVEQYTNRPTQRPEELPSGQ